MHHTAGMAVGSTFHCKRVEGARRPDNLAPRPSHSTLRSMPTGSKAAVPANPSALVACLLGAVGVPSLAFLTKIVVLRKYIAWNDFKIPPPHGIWGVRP